MRLRQLAPVSATVLALGCSAPGTAVTCTLIGCVSGLFVSFSTAPTGPVQVYVTTPKDTTPRVYDCTVGPQCMPVPLFTSYMPDTAYITVTYAGRTMTTEVHPVYEPQYPNGKACGAACTSAKITLPLP